MTIIEEKINELSEDLKKETLDYVDFLIEKKMKKSSLQKRPAGIAKGKIILSDDFQSPLSDKEMKQLGFL